MLQAAPALHVLNRDAAGILGSPIGSIEHVHVGDVILEKVAQLRLMGDRLSLLHSHDALLLRHSFSIPKILYILRTAPCFLSAHIDAYDSLLRSLLSDIINVSLADDSTRLQASLPVGIGGIGIRRAAQLAPSAFLASVVGSSDLVRQILLAPFGLCPRPIFPREIDLAPLSESYVIYY